MYKYLTIFVFLFGSVFADEDLSKVLNHTNYEPNFFSLIFSLLIVVGLVYLTGIIYKKLTKIKFDKTQDEREIKIVSCASLGQNKNLYIIKVGSDYSLIGATQNNITHIKELGEYNEN